MCKITIEDKEYTAPLSIINISNVRSCRINSCITEVYVRENNQLGGRKYEK